MRLLEKFASYEQVMIESQKAERYVAIACGGTGGHLFPGTAVAGALQHRGCDVLLIVSEKEIDKNNIRPGPGLDVLSLPAVALLADNFPIFLKSSWRSLPLMRRAFKKRKPDAVLAMGGFTSAPP